MKTALRVILFLTVITTSLYAGMQGDPSKIAVSLPQPCTILLCTAGLVFFGCLNKIKRIP